MKSKNLLKFALLTIVVATSLFTLSDCNSANEHIYEQIVSNEDMKISDATRKALTSAVKVSANFDTGKKSEHSAAGSGVIYKLDADTGTAFIITNHHVVYNNMQGISESIKLNLYGAEEQGSEITAEYVGGSMYYDIAVLYVNNCERLKNSVYQATDIAASDDIEAGDVVIAVGNPKNYGISASFGIVSVPTEYIIMTTADTKNTVTQRVLRTDTAVNSGNSGGGLFNSHGELVGIVNAKIVDEAVENIAYAIPVDVATAVCDNIIDNCFEKQQKSVIKSVLGITLTTDDSYATFDSDGALTIRESVCVRSVATGSLADGILLPGDEPILAKLGDTEIEVTRRYHLPDLMLKARVGDILHLTVSRGGKNVELFIKITENSMVAI